MIVVLSKQKHVQRQQKGHPNKFAQFYSYKWVHKLVAVRR